MSASKKSTHQDWVDPDDAPDISEEPWVGRFAQAKVTGRPRLAKPKLSTTLRLSQEVVEYFKQDGKGWQTRINAALQEHISAHK